MVEDDPFWQDLISQAIRAQYGKQVSVRCTRSVHQADNLVFNGHYDLLIFDQMLEGKETGLNLWESLRGKQNYVPMIMLSSITQDEFATATNAKLSKPIFIEKRAFRANNFAKVLDLYMKWPHELKPTSFQMKKITARLAILTLVTIAFALLKFLDRPNLAFEVGPVLTAPVISKLVSTSADPLATEVVARPAQFKRPSGKNSNKAKIESLITPELQSQINRIVQRQDETNKILSQTNANLRF